jgi:hypothetical protein
MTQKGGSRAGAVLTKVFETGSRSDVRGRAGGLHYVKIASRSALVTMKVFGGMMRDEADIFALINSGPVNLTPFPLSHAVPGLRQAGKSGRSQTINS